MPAPKGNKFAVGNKGGGRPSEYAEEYADIAYKLCLLGATDAEIADILGFSEDTINEWKKKHEDFSLSLKKGKLIADSEVASRLYERALGFEHDSVHISVYDGEVMETPIRKIHPPDTAAAIFWLKNRQPGKWRDKQDITLAGDKENPLKHELTLDVKNMTDEQLRQIASGQG